MIRISSPIYQLKLGMTDKAGCVHVSGFEPCSMEKAIDDVPERLGKILFRAGRMARCRVETSFIIAWDTIGLVIGVIEMPVQAASRYCIR